LRPEEEEAAMSRQTIPGLALGLAVLAAPAAQALPHAITDSAKGRLLARDGKVWLASSDLPSGFEGWSLARRGGTGAIPLVSGDRWDGWYLAFDPEGKDPKVTLARREGAGTQWKRTHVKGTAAKYTIQATKGKYKGWFVGAGKAHAVKGKDGKKYTDYEAVLEKDPKKPLRFSIYEVAP
jgi:hypothetical protein